MTVLGRLGRWLGAGAAPAAAGRRAFRQFDGAPAAIYAVGDVHGCYTLLAELEERILADARQYAGEKWIIMLGDYVDRGPMSPRVLDHLRQPPADPAIGRICLAGNHEAAMLEFLAAPSPGSPWLQFGGTETLVAYGIDPRQLERRLSRRELGQLVASHVPDEHREFLAGLPVLVETPGQIFVHAGLRPGVPLAAQKESDLTWIRDDFTETYESFGKTVVHGHTPRSEPLVTPSRVALDTGAYLTGRLTAAVFCPGEPIRLIGVEARPKWLGP
ncbi:metallophosphoesterase family protein [Devosia sp.]|uniref:metallophosphoesterase family protein n=1 Tax=Devosia sp. TaxID=1871048 RepID=UPI002F18E10B